MTPDCKTCTYAKAQYGHGECWTECRHKEHGQPPYENILWGCHEEPKPAPEWCPLKKEIGAHKEGD